MHIYQLCMSFACMYVIISMTFITIPGCVNVVVYINLGYSADTREPGGGMVITLAWNVGDLVPFLL